MTQLEMARQGIISGRMEEVARLEGLDAETICRGVASGVIVIPANINHGRTEARGIGKGLSTKVNANIGTSSDYINLNTELNKVLASPEFNQEMTSEAMTLMPMTPTQFTNYIKEDIARWAKVAKERHIEIE